MNRKLTTVIAALCLASPLAMAGHDSTVLELDSRQMDSITAAGSAEANGWIIVAAAGGPAAATASNLFLFSGSNEKENISISTGLGVAVGNNRLTISGGTTSTNSAFKTSYFSRSFTGTTTSVTTHAGYSYSRD